MIHRLRNRLGVRARYLTLWRQDHPQEVAAVVWFVACVAVAALVLAVGR